jgi:hypothetical protein
MISGHETIFCWPICHRIGLPRWNRILTQFVFLHNKAITGIQWMVCWWVSGSLWPPTLVCKKLSVPVVTATDFENWNYNGNQITHLGSTKIVTWLSISFFYVSNQNQLTITKGVFIHEMISLDFEWIRTYYWECNEFTWTGTSELHSLFLVVMHVFKNNDYEFSYQLQSWLVSKNWI